MTKELRLGGLTWLYINKPTSEDLDRLKNVFKFHPLAMQSIVAPTHHPFIEDYGDHLFLILHFPIIYQDWQANEIAEVDFLITEKIIVTVTYMDFSNLEQLFADVQKNPKIQSQLISNNVGFLLYYVLDRLFQMLDEDADFIEEEILQIENEIFEKRNQEVLEKISHTRRDIIDFRRHLRPQSAVLKLFVEKAGNFYGSGTIPYFHDLLTTEDRIINFIESQKETIDALYQTNESLMSSKISKIIAILTIFSAIILPLNFIASIWGMNHRIMPLRDNPFDFWIVVGAMFAIATSLFVYFRKKQWL